MVDNFKNLLQLQRYFKDEKVCIEYLEAQKWNGSPVCPHCGTGNPYKTITRSRKVELKGTLDYRCRNKECFKKFTAITGTIFENTKIDLKTWFAAIYIATAHKKGISSLQLSKDLGITQKTAWFVLHRIREMLKIDLPDMLTGTVEVDETYVGGKDKNRHANKKKGGRGRSTDKTPVVGLLQRNGKVVTHVVTDTSASTIQPIMVATVAKDALLITDNYLSYKGLEQYYTHAVVKAVDGNFKTEGEFHTNNIEGFWSLLKRGLYGIYHQVSPKHLSRYCDEFSARYNTRGIKDNERFEWSIKNCAGRLKYSQLIASSLK